MRRALAALVVTSCSLSCWVKTFSAPIHRVPIANDVGFTDCDEHGNPEIFLSDTMGNIGVKYVSTHEEKHASRMTEIGCLAFKTKYKNDTLFRFEEEAIAYCAEGRAMASDGYNVDSIAKFVYAGLRSHGASRGFDDRAVRQALNCNLRAYRRRGSAEIVLDYQRLP